MSRDLKAGLRRLHTIASQLEEAPLLQLKELSHAQKAATQPWIIFGCSDGIGLQTTLAAIRAGVLKHGLGVYFEPPHLIELNTDGTPVSPVHYARRQNAEALTAFAEEHGATFKVVYANCMMVPQRNLKGDIKDPANPLDPKIVQAFEKIRESASCKDAILINSVAFGKWMCPREGMDPIEVPSVNFDGEIVMRKTKPYHARGYEETLDTMGRNHKQLLDTALTHRWLGPHSLTAFYTWAGGSQNIDVLAGIYGKGALGDAKAIAEADTVAFRLEHGLSLGSHAVVRLPAFLSAALMGIPGGGLFGLISRQILSHHHCFFDMPILAARAVRRMLGDEWMRSNPIAQIELDMQETLHMEEIKAAVAAANDAIAKTITEKGLDPSQPIPLDISRELLKPFAGEDYVEVLGRFRPDINGLDEPTPQAKTAPIAAVSAAAGATPPSTTTDSHPSFKGSQKEHHPRYHTCMSDWGDIRPDIPLFETLKHLKEVPDLVDLQRFTVIAEDLIVEAHLGDTELSTSFEVQKIGDNLKVFRSIKNDRGEQVAKGTMILGQRPLLRMDDDLGQPIGHAMTLRTPLDAAYGPEYEEREFQRPAVLKFVADQLRSSGGLLDDVGKLRLSARFGEPVKVGQILRTFAKNTANSFVVSIIGDQRQPVLRLELRQ